MRNIFLFLVVMSAISAGAEAQLPSIQPPVDFRDEGTETQLTLEQVKEIKPWAENSRNSLANLLEMASDSNLSEARRILIEGLTEIVGHSQPKRTELLMRYVLNRSLKVVDEIEKVRGHQ